MKVDWKHKSVKRLESEYGALYGSDPIEIIRSLTRKLVLQAFTKGWNGPPFDIIELARLLKFEVLPTDLVVDARISPKGKSKFIIEYNPFQSPTRINFSLAHEIGHTMFTDCAETVRYRSKELERDSWELEFLCNIAAAEILLPYAKFYKDANEIPLSLNGLKVLANKYGASLESVFIRFCEVVDKPCMAMICQLNHLDQLEMQYMVKSDLCELNDFRSDFNIPKDSSAYECLKAGWTSHRVENWEAFSGTGYRIHSIGLRPIRKQIQPRVGIFIVPEHYEKVPGNSIYMVHGDATMPRGTGNKIIAQVVNTSAGSGFGFGKAMSNRYPLTRKALIKWKERKDLFRLGNCQTIQINETTWVCQMIAQEGIFPKYGQIPLKYDSLRKCLSELSEVALNLKASIHMPMIGAGQAGGDWEIIQGIIHQELIKKNVEVTVYVLPGNKKVKEETETDLFNQVAYEQQ